MSGVPEHRVDSCDAFILRALEDYEMPSDAGEVMRFARFLYGQGYIDSLTDTARASRVSERATESEPA